MCLRPPTGVCKMPVSLCMRRMQAWSCHQSYRQRAQFVAVKQVWARSSVGLLAFLGLPWKTSKLLKDFQVTMKIQSRTFPCWCSSRPWTPGGDFFRRSSSLIAISSQRLAKYIPQNCLLSCNQGRWVVLVVCSCAAGLVAVGSNHGVGKAASGMPYPNLSQTTTCKIVLMVPFFSKTASMKRNEEQSRKSFCRHCCQGHPFGTAPWGHANLYFCLGRWYLKVACCCLLLDSRLFIDDVSVLTCK